MIPIIFNVGKTMCTSIKHLENRIHTEGKKINKNELTTPNTGQ
jgi:hypothetical protein